MHAKTSTNISVKISDSIAPYTICFAAPKDFSDIKTPPHSYDRICGGVVF
jgi:hypothetical protein